MQHQYVDTKTGDVVWTEGGFAEDWITAIFHPKLTIGRRRQRTGSAPPQPCSSRTWYRAAQPDYS